MECGPGHVLNDMRREMVVRYVRNDALVLSGVAEVPGYSRQSSFNRWLANELGTAPTHGRKSN